MDPSADPPEHRELPPYARWGLAVLLPALLLGLFGWGLFRSATFQHWLAAIPPSALPQLAIPVGLLCAGAFFLIDRFRPRAPAGASARAFGRSRSVCGSGLTVALAVLVFVLPAASAWCRVETSYDMLLSVFPWSDARSYYQDADQLLGHGTLSEWAANRRPFSTCFLAARLALVGGDLRAAALLQGGLMGVSALILARTVAQDLGRGAGVACFAALLAFGAFWVNSTMTEATGLVLGTLALAAIWSGVRRASRWLVFGGVTALTLALSARAGGQFVLPAVLVWATFASRRRGLWGWRMAAGVAGAIVVGLALNAMIPVAHGRGARAGNSNFAHTFYGLAVGQPGWKQIYRDFPEVRTLPGEEQAGFAWQRAVEAVRRDPATLVQGCRRAFKLFLRGYVPYLTAPFVVRPSTAGTVVVGLLSGLGFLLFLRREAWRPLGALVLAGAAGVLLSGVVVGQDGGPRVLLAVFPFFSVGLACAVAGLFGPRGVTPVSGEGGALPLVLVGVVYIAAVGVPTVAHVFVARKAPRTRIANQDDDGPRVLWVEPSAPRFEIRPAPGTVYVPRARGPELPFAWLAGADVLLLVRDISNPAEPALTYVKAPRSIVSDDVRVLRVWGREREIAYWDGNLRILEATRFEVLAEE